MTVCNICKAELRPSEVLQPAGEDFFIHRDEKLCMEIQKRPPRMGDRLANGWTVLECREYKHGGFLVLAYRDVGDMSTARSKYATWRCTNRDDTIHGNYHRDYLTAALDFATRGEQYAAEWHSQEQERVANLLRKISPTLIR